MKTRTLSAEVVDQLNAELEDTVNNAIHQLKAIRRDAGRGEARLLPSAITAADLASTDAARTLQILQLLAAHIELTEEDS